MRRQSWVGYPEGAEEEGLNSVASVPQDRRAPLTVEEAFELFAFAQAADSHRQPSGGPVALSDLAGH